MNEPLIGIPSETFNSITNYLMSRPYKEVHQLITELKSVAQMVTVQPQEEEEQSDDD